MPAERRDRLTVTLEVDAPGDPIRGVARDARGVEHPFSGWVALATAIEQALKIAAEGAPGAPLDSPREHAGARP
jgi:hypothetical protein